MPNEPVGFIVFLALSTVLTSLVIYLTVRLLWPKKTHLLRVIDVAVQYSLKTFGVILVAAATTIEVPVGYVIGGIGLLSFFVGHTSRSRSGT